MEREEFKNGFQLGDWGVTYLGWKFRLNNNGIKLMFLAEEELEKIFFDVEKKTVSVKVNKPILSEKIPRTVDLSDATKFFDELRKDIEKILMVKGTFKSVTPNEDRTIFEVS